MANTKSAEKRDRQDDKRYAHNRWYRSRYRTFVKRTRFYIAQGDAEQAQDAMGRAVQALDRAAQRNIIHENKASRLKSRLAKAFAKLEA